MMSIVSRESHSNIIESTGLHIPDANKENLAIRGGIDVVITHATPVTLITCPAVMIRIGQFQIARISEAIVATGSVLEVEKYCELTINPLHNVFLNDFISQLPLLGHNIAEERDQQTGSPDLATRGYLRRDDRNRCDSIAWYYGIQ